MALRFRPCIDLCQDRVTQIVGSTLSEHQTGQTAQVNFTASRPAEYFAALFREHELPGGHVIRLDRDQSSNAAAAALAAYPNGLRLGGGMNQANARHWIDAGAEALIFTSWVFHDGLIDYDRLQKLADTIGKERITLDLSCRLEGDRFRIATDRWTKRSAECLDLRLLGRLADYASEFLVHAIDVEGRQQGLRPELIRLLNRFEERPITYAGGITSPADLAFLYAEGWRLDFTVGSALDIFGGKGLCYDDLRQEFGDG